MPERVVIALAAAALAAPALAIACGGDGGGSPDGGSETANPTPADACAMALPPLSDEPLTAERFDEANAGLDEAIAQARRGAPDEGLVAFFLLSHDLTHDVDGPLRDADEGLAIRLCNEVLQLEELVGVDVEPERVAELARSTRELLAEAREALGVEEGPP